MYYLGTWTLGVMPQLQSVFDKDLTALEYEPSKLKVNLGSTITLPPPNQALPKLYGDPYIISQMAAAQHHCSYNEAPCRTVFCHVYALNPKT